MFAGLAASLLSGDVVMLESLNRIDGSAIGTRKRALAVAPDRVD
jgi:hypothetical protein